LGVVPAALEQVGASLVVLIPAEHGAVYYQPHKNSDKTRPNNSIQVPFITSRTREYKQLAAGVSRFVAHDHYKI
jgi:hypothetical protein